MMRFRDRLAALEALEAAQNPATPAYVCMHAADYAALTDPATLAEMRQAIGDAYQLGGERQKLYVGLCMCDAPEGCRVCDDRPVIGVANHF